MDERPKIRRARLVSRITTWTLRVMVAVTALFFLAVVLAATLGGNGETQRKALEKIASGIFGMPVHIHQLNRYQLFPTQRIDAEQFIVMKDGDAEPSALIEKFLYVSDPLAAWRGRLPIEAISFDHLITRPGYFGPYSLHLKQGRIAVPADGISVTSFQITGTYGDLPLRVAMPMTVDQGGAQGRYRFEGPSPITVQVGNVNLTFRVQVQTDRVIFEDIQIQNDETRLSGTMVFPRGKTAPAPLVYQLTDVNSGTVFTGEIQEFGEKLRLKNTGASSNEKQMKRLLSTVFVQGKTDPIVFMP